MTAWRSPAAAASAKKSSKNLVRASNLADFPLRGPVGLLSQGCGPHCSLAPPRMARVFAANSIDETSRGRVEECPRRDFEGFGDIYEPFVQDSALPVFNVHEHVPGDSRTQGQRLLRHPPGKAKTSDVAPYSGPRLLPFRDALRTVLAGARRHAHQ